MLFPFAMTSTTCSQSLPPSDSYVYILINSTIYDSLSSSLLTHRQDLENAGFSVEIPQEFGNTSESIRNFLQNEASIHEIAGVLLVGDVPYASFEMNDTGCGYEKFPCDLYYMDLNGNWTDSDGNGIYDMHTNETGDLEPEMWVGRLYASTVPGSETELLINYFVKTHRFRTGELTLPKRALGYVDDDFVESYADDVNSSLRMVYDNETTLIIDTETTNAADYKNRLNDTLGYEWLHLVSHGSFEKHAFRNSSGQSDVYPSDVESIDPHVLFYNLATCDAAYYLFPDYIGGSYIFTNTYGLLVVSSTKLGAMLNYNDFYGPVAEGKCIGQAFKEWFEKNGEIYPFFYYGLTLLGDPTLRAPRVCDVAVTSVTPSKSVVVRNQTLPVNVTVKNKHAFTETFHVQTYANTTFVGNKTVTDLPPLATKTLTFIWNTTGIIKGNYCLNATAVLLGDCDPNDNKLVCWVEVILEDDVAVSAVIPSETVVVQNRTLSIIVTVENKGNATETFNVTAHANATTVIGTLEITLTRRNSTVITFDWNTTNVAKGNHILSAIAMLSDDDDPEDNTCIDGWVAVILKDDIIVTSVAPSRTAVSQGHSISVNVTVENRGNSTATFNVTAYANATSIGETTVVNLLPLATGTLTFDWNTTDVAKGNYTISAYAHPIPGETYTADNTFTDGWFLVMIPGDINCDSEVNVLDMLVLKIVIDQGKTVEEFPFGDINCDSEVNVLDMLVLKIILTAG